MASLSTLKRSMTMTMFLVGLLLFLLVGGVALLLLPGSGIFGWIIVIFLTLLFILLQWIIGPAAVKWSTKLRYIQTGENPFLETMVDSLCIKADVPKPRLAIVNDPTPNAFVFGRSTKSATLAVHTGLLQNLNNEEIEAVIGHELGHIKHKDMVIMTVANSVPLIAYMVAMMFFFGGRGRSSREAGWTLAIALLAYVIYWISLMFVLRLSRLREYFADSYSALLTKNPHGLSSALTKITFGLSLSKKEPHGARAFYIGDPTSAKREISHIISKKSQYDLDGDGVIDEYELEKAMEAEAKSKWRRGNELFSTHPPTFRRILQLKQIEEELRASGGVGLEAV